MADTTDALLDIMYHLTVVHGVRLKPATLRECRKIFDGTIGWFAGEAARQSARTHPWDDKQFRAFILGQVKRIAKEATATAPSGALSPAVFRKAAKTVMMDTNRFCRLAVKRGRLEFTTKKWTREGLVCTMYLAETLGGVLREG